MLGIGVRRQAMVGSLARRPGLAKPASQFSRARRPGKTPRQLAVIKTIAKAARKPCRRLEAPRAQQSSRRRGVVGDVVVASPSVCSKISPALRNTLASWGPSLARQVAVARRQWLETHGVRVSGEASPRVKVGTDCSGAEAPIWALRAMQVPHTHVFSCDWKERVRDFIKATSPPAGPIFADMLQRRCEDIPAMDIYVCGFPCTPFSTLRHHRTRLLKEDAAKPFFCILRVLRERKPKLAVLENVMGIRQVMAKVLRYLGGTRMYQVIVLPIDSLDLGEPVSRPRYYFLLVRRDVGVLNDAKQIKSLVAAMAHAAFQPVTAHIADRMFLNASPCVQSYLGKVAQICDDAKGSADSTRKWHAQHEAFSKAKGLRLGGNLAEGSGLCTQRMRSALHLWKQHLGKAITADFSQSIGRVGARADGVAPTITPAGLVFVGGRGVDRVITPREKLAINLFPIHTMSIPEGFPEAELGRLGGNTMHLKSIGLALAIGMALVDFSPASPTAQLGKNPRAIVLPLHTVRRG